MHSVLKQENETADMVEKLALMQRQNVEWFPAFASKEAKGIKSPPFPSLEKSTASPSHTYTFDL